jgi:hypothetical protein
VAPGNYENAATMGWEEERTHGAFPAVVELDEGIKKCCAVLYVML